MGRMRFGLAVWMLAFGGMLTAVNVAARADELSDAMDMLSRNDAAGAYQLLKPEERKRAGNPDYDYALGLAAADTGHPNEAVAAFERVLAVKPDHLQARAELGRAFIELNEPEAARRELATVEASDNVPPAVRANINRYVTALDTGLSGGGTSIKSNLTITAGYDSNVNNSTSDSRILIPAFSGLGYATLSGSATSQEDTFGEVAGHVSLTHGLSIDRRLIADLSASYRGNASQEHFNQAIAGLNIGVAQATPDWGTFTISAQAQSYWVDGKPYRYTLGALGQWSFTTKARTDYGAYLQYAHQTFPGSSAQNTDRVTLGATIGMPIQTRFSPYVFAGAYGGIEEASHSANDNLSYYFVGARAGGELKLSDRWTGFANVAIETDNYKKQEPLFLKKRSSVRADASLGARYALTQALTVVPQVSYTNADSNIVLYDYDRVVGSVALSLDF